MPPDSPNQIDFLSAIESFRGRGPGSESFEAFADDCYRLARLQQSNAGFYVLLGMLSRASAEQQEGYPPEIGRTQEAKLRVIEQAERISACLMLNPEVKLALLNDLGHALVSGR
jgi:hypothetical protein